MHEKEILLKLTEIENLLRRRDSKVLNLVEAAQYLSLSNSQIYKYKSQRKIPFHKPAGKCLYFFKDELDEWIRRNDPHPNPHPSPLPQSGKPEGEGKEQTAEENQLGLFGEEDETETH